MELKDKVAVIFGGGGAIGGAVAVAFAREGARVFLAGRNKEPLEKVAAKIKDAGGLAEVVIADALNKKSVDTSTEAIFNKTGRIDISFNAIGVYHLQGVPLMEMSPEEFELPLNNYVSANFLTATAAARQMVKRNAGVILTISTPGALLASALAGGFGVSNAAVEGLSRQLAGELGEYGIRVICLRSDAIPETIAAGSHAKEVFGHRAELINVSLEELPKMMAQGSMLKRSPTLEDLANTAVFMASEKARAITATVTNVTCGSLVG
jgi:NAD(P)-dependent dehydrogenase (short-subunit alcohol dehydrogenase family)